MNNNQVNNTQVHNTHVIENLYRLYLTDNRVTQDHWAVLPYVFTFVNALPQLDDLGVSVMPKGVVHLWLEEQIAYIDTKQTVFKFFWAGKEGWKEYQIPTDTIYTDINQVVTLFTSKGTFDIKAHDMKNESV